jgi:hypothetical protein
MKGFVLAEAGHVVQILPPQNISGGKTGQAFSMKTYQHASILVMIGAQAAAFTKILVNQCTDAAGSNAAAIPFALYAQETADADVLGARQQITAAGKTPSGNADIFYVIELDGSELSDGFPYVQVELTNGANADYGTIVAVLSGARFAEAQSPTAIA